MYTLLILATLGQFPNLNQQPAGPWPSFSLAPIEQQATPPIPGRLRVLAFTASWCAPCRQLRPLLATIEAEGVTVEHVDVDQQQDVAAQYRVSALPTTIAVRGGVEVARRVGLMSLDALRTLAGRPSPPPQPAKPTEPVVSGRYEWRRVGVLRQVRIWVPAQTR